MALPTAPSKISQLRNETSSRPKSGFDPQDCSKRSIWIPLLKWWSQSYFSTSKTYDLRILWYTGIQRRLTLNIWELNLKQNWDRICKAPTFMSQQFSTANIAFCTSEIQALHVCVTTLASKHQDSFLLRKPILCLCVSSYKTLQYMSLYLYLYVSYMVHIWWFFVFECYCIKKSYMVPCHM